MARNSFSYSGIGARPLIQGGRDSQMSNHRNAKRKELKMTNRSIDLAVSAPRRSATMRAAKPFLGLAAIALLVVLSLGTVGAKADTIQTFDLTGTFDSYAPGGKLFPEQ